MTDWVVDTSQIAELDAALRVNLTTGIERYHQGLEILAEAIMTLSKSQFVPVVTGHLRSTGYVEPGATTGADRSVVTMGYSAEYALVVHERPASIGQGKNKYLERPFLLLAPRVEQFLKRHMQ